MGTEPFQKRGERAHFKFPHGYGDNIIVSLARDPWWIFCYWEINAGRQQEIAGNLAAQGESARRSILRVYDVTDVEFNGKNAHSFFDIELKGLANNWYINVNSPDRSWVVDIGVLSDKGNFYLLARSNTVRTPRFGMSDTMDSEWMTAEEDYWRMFGLSGGFGSGKGSMESREMIRKRLEEQVSSGGLSSSASFYRKPAQRKFWLVVNTELIVYGATEPDAHLTVQGKKVDLRSDGTFAMRFTLPDGKQVIPVEAVSHDGIDRQRVTPVVTKKAE
jgi:hypothetical protein